MLTMILSSVVIAILSWCLTGFVLHCLKRRTILDHPNERSSHSIPTPRGGGISVVFLTLALWLLLPNGLVDLNLAYLLSAAIILALISWIDDLKSLAPGIKFGVQIVAILLGAASLPLDAKLFQGILPYWLDTALICIGWLWFVNLFNFMDGIDGISSVETITICAGLLALSWLDSSGISGNWFPLTLGAVTVGFLWWNKPPARIFLGDVGSIPIGFLLGWLLIDLAFTGNWASALILPMYYLCDATITILKRALSGKKIWLAHREHSYQQAVQIGKSHLQVSGAIALVNIVLIGLSLYAVYQPHTALAISAVVVIILMRWMRK